MYSKDYDIVLSMFFSAVTAVPAIALVDAFAIHIDYPRLANALVNAFAISLMYM